MGLMIVHNITATVCCVCGCVFLVGTWGLISLKTNSTVPSLAKNVFLSALLLDYDLMMNFSVGVTEVERTIRAELGADICELFLEFDAQAIAAASLAQVCICVCLMHKL